MNQSNYTKPKLCKASDGKWYVYFRYDRTLIKYRRGINREKNLKKKEFFGKQLAAALLIKLKEGWNPIDSVDTSSPKMNIIEAFEFALDQKKPKTSPKTFLGYRGTIGYFLKAIKGIALHRMNIQDIKRVHIRKILERAKNDRDWSNKARNKNLNYLKAVLSELVDWDIIEVNPAHNIKNLPVEENEANIPPTKEEKNRIQKHLQENYPYFYLFVLCLFYTGIRPNEVLGIKLEMIDLGKKQIILPANNTKTRKQRIVPINPHFMTVLQNMDLSIYPKDFYLFGSYRTPGKGNVGKHIDFIPAPTRIKRDTATKRWFKVVKTELKINVNMYSIKHYAANELILSGVSLDAIRELFGHSSKVTTAIYAKRVKEVYRDEIIDKYREF